MLPPDPKSDPNGLRLQRLPHITRVFGTRPELRCPNYGHFTTVTISEHTDVKHGIKVSFLCLLLKSADWLRIDVAHVTKDSKAWSPVSTRRHCCEGKQAAPSIAVATVVDWAHTYQSNNSTMLCSKQLNIWIMPTKAISHTHACSNFTGYYSLDVKVNTDVNFCKESLPHTAECPNNVQKEISIRGCVKLSLLLRQTLRHTPEKSSR